MSVPDSEKAQPTVWSNQRLRRETEIKYSRKQLKHTVYCTTECSIADVNSVVSREADGNGQHTCWFNPLTTMHCLQFISSRLPTSTNMETLHMHQNLHSK